MHQVGRPESQDRAGVYGHGNWACGATLTMQVPEDTRSAFQVWETDCSCSLIPQGGHSHFGSSGSVTSENVLRSHEPTRASVRLCQPCGVAERAGRQLGGGLNPSSTTEYTRQLR